MKKILLAAERAENELPDADAVTAFESALLVLTSPADLKLAVRTLKVRRFNTRAIVHVGFTNGQSATLRIALDRVLELRDQLTRVLGKAT